MLPFTTRPEIMGRFGVVTSTHWIASAVGMSILEKGGNAFDAAAATGFTLQVVEPHLNGPAGDMTAVFYSKARDKVQVLCAQGSAPSGATIAHYTAEGLTTIPGNGLLATVVPGVFDGWMLLLRDYGRLSLRDVLEPAIAYARDGHPVLPQVSDKIRGLADFFRSEWPSSFETWLPGGSVPEPASNFRRPMLAETWTRLLQEAEGHPGRESQIEAARRVFYEGFIAERIDAFVRTTEVMDGSGRRHRGVLSGDDLANWRATFEAPLTYDYHGWTVAKIGPWGQGPAMLQSLALLEAFDLAGVDPSGADFIHIVVEAMKLAFADREIYYGDPRERAVPMDRLLSRGYADERRRLIGLEASLEQRPGRLAGFEDQHSAALAMIAARGKADGAVYEPTMSHLSEQRNDTVHLDVIDNDGNMVSATPSGGWLSSSPVIPDLGFCLNSRAQMFWLRPGLPSSLAPGKRPRTTLSPTIASFEGRPTLAFGTPGGDQQDQWQLIFFLRCVHFQANLQEAIDWPLFHSAHIPSSFHPRTWEPGNLAIESSVGSEVLDALRSRGHRLKITEPWQIGRLTAARRDADGLLRAAATPRMMQAYAVGR